MTNVELSQKVWNNLKGSVDKAAKFEDLVAVSFSLISESNEDIFVVVENGVLRVEPYFYNDCGCVIEASAEIVDKLFSGSLSFDKALSDGTAKVQRGDAAKFKALECLVPEKKTKAVKSAKTTKSAPKAAAKAAPKAAAKTDAKPVAKEEPKAAPEKAEAKPVTAPATAAAAPAKPAAAAKPAAKPGKKKKK